MIRIAQIAVDDAFIIVVYNRLVDDLISTRSRNQVLGKTATHRRRRRNRGSRSLVVVRRLRGLLSLTMFPSGVISNAYPVSSANPFRQFHGYLGRRYTYPFSPRNRCRLVLVVC